MKQKRFSNQKEEPECPLCNFKTKKFLPGGLNKEVLKKYKVIGAGFRKNKFCPKCGSKDRERHLYLYIKLRERFFSNKKLIKVLHIAPEKCLSKKIKKMKNSDYYAIDLNELLGSVKMDIKNMNFNNDYFDYIICLHVLEHIEDDVKAMKELFRVLKKNGILFLMVPFSLTIKSSIEDKKIKSPNEREKKFGQADHIRIYSKKDFLERLNKSGFKISEESLDKLYGKEIIRKYALIKGEKIFVCKKRS